MNNLQIVDQRELLGQDFKIYGTKENPLFLAKDVAEWIDYSYESKVKGIRKVSQLVDMVEDEEKIKGIYNVATTSDEINTSRKTQETWFLTEDGLYEVLMQSRKPIAKVFKKEVKKVLKQIRQTGGYIPIANNMSDTEIMAQALMVAQRTMEQKDKLLAAKEVELNSKNRFINQIAISENSLLVREVAKIASKADVVIGEKRLWQKLREWGLIFKNSTEPKQTGIDMGCFEVSEGTRNSKGKVFTYSTTRVTGKGQAYIINRLLKEEN